jgi:hypothetical protein
MLYKRDGGLRTVFTKSCLLSHWQAVLSAAIENGFGMHVRRTQNILRRRTREGVKVYGSLVASEASPPLVQKFDRRFSLRL